MDLILVRHAIAGEYDPSRWPNDSDRPLTPRGIERFERAAATLRTISGPVDLVFASSYRRAWQTAEILEQVAGWPAPVACVELQPDRQPTEIIERCHREHAAVIALVSHEPLLGELAATLLAGEGARALPFKKGGAARLTAIGEAAAGDMSLVWWLPPKVLRQLGSG